ncbi:hypothetical protein OG767_02925 [Micromonospora sp. NBC_01392]|uniref:hypothetical protein n=1 Tax=Micromonospora sp. NBC_01392 TaxID=2903588 RepID=UPI00324634EF
MGAAATDTATSSAETRLRPGTEALARAGAAGESVRGAGVTRPANRSAGCWPASPPGRASRLASGDPARGAGT